jgi:hypothetical protein
VSNKWCKKSYAEYAVKGVYISVAVCAVAFLTYKAYQIYIASNTATMPNITTNTPDINLPEAPTLTAPEIQAPMIPDIKPSIDLLPVVSQEVITAATPVETYEALQNIAATLAATMQKATNIASTTLHTALDNSIAAYNAQSPDEKITDFVLEVANNF